MGNLTKPLEIKLVRGVVGGVVSQGVSLLSQSHGRVEVNGRGLCLHTILTQLLHAFVQTLKPVSVEQRCFFTSLTNGFSLLGLDYGEKEEEESFELRNKEDLTPNGRTPTEVTVSQPTCAANGTNG
ncbi:hypothetical protein CHARACLAT_003231, partial [Characodon lateralis]|nr:hypothetical protein [Characodon lateralis]